MSGRERLPGLGYRWRAYRRDDRCADRVDREGAKVRIIPVPAKLWPQMRRQTIAAPSGDLLDDDIRPLEAVVDTVELGDYGPTPVYRAVCQVEPGDLTKLAAGGYVVVSFYGRIVPWQIDVYNEDGGQ